jgi:[NiFe] hydrogenase assembly HybE family chaperone
LNTQASPALALEQLFSDIARDRMQGVPLLNPALQVQALGFEPDPLEAGIWLGLLITPWFMNLVRMNSQAHAGAVDYLPAGEKATRLFGNTRFEFIGVFEPSLGAFETCSLFSPMFEFADHSAAVATATEVLSQLRQVAPAASPKAPASPSRRGFLFGRAAAPVGEPA